MWGAIVIKVSKFNTFFLYDNQQDKYIAYNAMSNSLALIKSSNYKKYVDFEENGNEIDDEELIKDFKKGAFLIEDDVDEFKQLKFSMYKSRFSSKFFSLTIAPTSDCNFRCIYCYEKNSLKNELMDKETQNSLIEWLENKINSIESFHVTWYGGEPLLAMDVIEKLSREFIKICNNNSVDYSAEIITNGYHLTEDIVNKLKKCKVSSVQITIDGNEKTHDKRRPLMGGQPTFKTIISNLTKLNGQIDKIALRINVDNKNINGVYELIDNLVSHGLNKTITPYLGHVDNCNNCYSEDFCLDFKEYCKEEFKFNDYLKSKGFGVSCSGHYPSRIYNYCSADLNNSFVVNANGDLYLCWNDIGIEELMIGNVNQLDKVQHKGILFEYLIYDPTEDEECSKCNILPVCMGGCPNKRINKYEDRCSSPKYMLKTYLQDIAHNIKAKQINA